MRERFLDYALHPTTQWEGNFRDLNAMVTRMGTLADGGRITLDLVEEEIARVTPADQASDDAETQSLLATHLGADYAEQYDAFDLVQLAHVIRVCRTSDSMADAARKLYAVSIRAKKSANHTDRLSKYLAKFNLKFRALLS